MKKILVLLPLTIIVLTLASCSFGQSLPAFSPIPVKAPLPASVSPANTTQASGEITLPRAADGQFKTPEDAIRYFVDCLKKNDFLAATEVFGIYEIPGKLDYAAYSDRLKITYIPSGYLPPDYEELNRGVVIGQAATCYKSAMMSLCGFDWSQVQVQSSPDDTAKFVSAVSPAKFSTLGVIMADMETTLSDDMKATHRTNMAAQAKVYGANAAKAYTVTLELNGKKATCDPLILVQYGANWYISGGTFTLGR